MGFSGTDQWRSTNERGRYFSIDTQLSVILEHPPAKAVVAALEPALLEASEPLHDRRSIRLLAMTVPALLDDTRLAELDRLLLALGAR